MLEDFTGKQLAINDWAIRCVKIGNTPEQKWVKILDINGDRVTTIGFYYRWAQNQILPDCKKSTNIHKSDKIVIMPEDRVPQDVIDAWNKY